VGGSPNSVDWGKVKTSEWDKKFDSITDNKKLNALIRDEALRIFEHRDNSDYEDLSIINATTNSLVGRSTNAKQPGETRYTEDLRRKIQAAHNRGKSLISIHNHPNDAPPSLSDLSSMNTRGYSKSIAIGHGGSIFVVDKIATRFMRYDYAESFNRHIQDGLNEHKAAIMALKELQDKGLISWREL